MARTTCHLSVSLDGYVAGPDQGPQDPAGVGGLPLHRWHQEAETSGSANDVMMRDELLAPSGAVVMGRNMFGPVRGDWGDGS